MTAQPNVLPDTAPLAVSANPSGDVRESQVEMPSVSVAIKQSPKETTTLQSLLSLLYHRSIFSGCPSEFAADVEQRVYYRRCRVFSIVIHPVSFATSNGGASRYAGLIALLRCSF